MAIILYPTFKIISPAFADTDNLPNMKYSLDNLQVGKKHNLLACRGRGNVNKTKRGYASFLLSFQ